MSRYVLLAVAGVLAVVGIMFVLAGRQYSRMAGVIAGVPTTPAADVARLSPGTPVEVTGTVRCTAPLRSELAGQACVYYASCVRAVYPSNESSDYRYEVLAEAQRHVPFLVEDRSGSVSVDAEAADMDVKKVVDRFDEPKEDGSVLTLAGTTVELRKRGWGLKGYDVQEGVLPVDVPVYVLGVVREGGTIGAPDDQRKVRLVVSYREEYDVHRHYGRTGRIATVVGAGSLILSFLCALAGMWTGIR